MGKHFEKIIYAEHIIGLPPALLGKYIYQKDAAVSEAAKQNYERIRASGVLKPRGNAPDSLGDSGSQRDFDVLAGDGKYIFLSLGPRYRETRPSELCYGFVFDVRQLITMGGLVGPDLLADYEALAEEVAAEVAADLPAEVPTAEEVREFAARTGITDPELLAHMRGANNASLTLYEAMSAGDSTVPGAERALELWRVRLPIVQAQRLSGVAAWHAVENCPHGTRLEILFPGELKLDMAVAYIEAGEIIPVSCCGI